MLQIGLVLELTENQFNNIEVPVTREGYKAYNHRKIIVSRDNIISKPTQICDLLSRNTRLLTVDEKEELNKKNSNSQKEKSLKRTNINLDEETKTINDLNKLIDPDNLLINKFIWEYRQGDIAYSIPETDKWLANQVKTAKSTKKDNCIFQAGKEILNVKKMLEILSKGLILTCIGKNIDNIIDVVWMFYGSTAIDMLNRS